MYLYLFLSIMTLLQIDRRKRSNRVKLSLPGMQLDQSGKNNSKPDVNCLFIDKTHGVAQEM